MGPDNVSLKEMENRRTVKGTVLYCISHAQHYMVAGKSRKKSDTVRWVLIPVTPCTPTSSMWKRGQTIITRTSEGLKKGFTYYGRVDYFPNMWTDILREKGYVR